MGCALCVAGHGHPVLPSCVFLVKCSEPNGDDSLFLISPYPPPTPNRFHIDLLLTVGVGILLQLLLPIINMIQDFFKRLGNISETTTAPLTEEMPTVFPSGFVSGGAQTGQSLGPGTLCSGCSPRVWGWGGKLPISPAQPRVLAGRRPRTLTQEGEGWWSLCDPRLRHVWSLRHTHPP